MTGFLTSDLPASINTVEKLHAWSSTVLNHLYRDSSDIEENGQAQFLAQSSPFLITAVSPSKWRLISRTSILLNPNWQKGSSKIWANAEDIGSAAIPVEFKS